MCIATYNYSEQVLFRHRRPCTLERNRGPGYNTLLLRLIPGDLLSACPHRQFKTLPGLLESRAQLHCQTLTLTQIGSLYHLYDSLWYDLVGARTRDLPHERRIRQPLSQPDAVYLIQAVAKYLAPLFHGKKA